MKKLLQRITVFALSAISLFGMVACGGGNGSNDPMTIDVYYWNSGNGAEYIEQILAEFKKENPEITIDIVKSESPGGDNIRYDAKNDMTDIYFTSMSDHMAYKEVFAPLNDVLDMEMDGVKVSSRIDANTINTLTNSDGNIYSLPWSNSVTGLVYNATIFEEKNFKIPRTTNELIDLCAQIQNAYPGEKDPKPFIHYPSYWDFGMFSWMAQYAGVDNFTKYWKGIYTDENGVEKVNDISLFKDNVAAQKALKVLFDLLSPKGYTVTGTNSLGHTISQTNFLSRKSVLIPNGSWMENEMKNSTTSDKFAIMKFPVISALGEKLGLGDEELAALVAYIDGTASQEETDYAESVDSEILARVSEARNVVCSQRLNFNIFIPANSPAKEAAKKLIAFYYSDKALEIAETVSGMMIPVNYSDGSNRKHPDNDTDFLKTCTKLINQNSKIIEATYTVPLIYNNGIENFWYYNPVEKFTYNNNTKGPALTYDKFLEDDASYWTKNWNNKLTNAGLI